MREGSPRFEPFKQKQREEEELKSKKEEKRARIGGIVKKVAVGSAIIGAMTAGTIKYEQYVNQHDKNIINNDKTGLDEKIKMEEALQELVKDPRVGYVDLDHYLEDHREVRENPEKLEEARKYFEAREKK